LYYADEKYIDPVPQPYFLFFVTINSHYPWVYQPPFTKDWRTLKYETPEMTREPGLLENLPKTYHTRVRSEETYNNYLNIIEYELKFITHFITDKAPDNSIFIIVGDHQPPIITQGDDSFETPIHVVSKDSAFVSSYFPYGFKAGMIKNPDEDQNMVHGGVYSLLIRNLAKNYSNMPADSLPQYMPEGVPLSIIQ
jgi:uncharacterized protein YfaT (DUF1175 family)